MLTLNVIDDNINLLRDSRYGRRYHSDDTILWQLSITMATIRYHDNDLLPYSKFEELTQSSCYPKRDVTY